MTTNQLSNLKRFRELVQWTEGTATSISGTNPYSVIVGYKFKITDFSTHPNKPVYIPSISNYSTAAGAYQFLYSTWVEVKNALGLKDFSAASQDAAFDYYLKQKGAYDYVINGNWALAIQKACTAWASLPVVTKIQDARGVHLPDTSYYGGQSSKTLAECLKFLGEKKSPQESCQWCGRSY